MCVPDLTVYTYDWVADDPEPMPNHAVQRMCVDWNQLEEWADEQRFSLSEKLIRRPDGKFSACLKGGKPGLLTYMQEQDGRMLSDLLA